MKITRAPVGSMQFGTRDTGHRNSCKPKITDYDLQLAEIAFEHLPCYIYWKNSSSQYLGANDNFLEILDMATQVELIGKTDYDLPWTLNASDLIQDDQSVLSLNGANNDTFFSTNIIELVGLFNLTRLVLPTTRRCFTYGLNKIIIAVSLKGFVG